MADPLKDDRKKKRQEEQSQITESQAGIDRLLAEQSAFGAGGNWALPSTGVQGKDRFTAQEIAGFDPVAGQRFLRALRGRYSAGNEEARLATGTDVGADVFTREQFESVAGDVQGEIARDIAAAQQRDKDLRTSIREARLERLKGDEARLTENLMGVRTEIDDAVDRQIAELLGDVGFRADQASAQLGAMQADRGLLRSTATERGQGRIQLGRLQEEGRLRQAGAEQKQAARETIEETQEGIKEAREAFEQAGSLAELKQAEDLVFSIDTQAFQNKINDKLIEIEQDAANRSIFGDILGGFAQGLGSIIGGEL